MPDYFGLVFISTLLGYLPHRAVCLYFYGLDIIKAFFFERGSGVGERGCYCISVQPCFFERKRNVLLIRFKEYFMGIFNHK